MGADVARGDKDGHLHREVGRRHEPDADAANSASDCWTCSRQAVGQMLSCLAS